MGIYQILSLLSGILGIIASITGTIMMLKKLRIDLSGLKAIEETKTKDYSGRDAYVNLRKQIEDSIKHTNKTEKDEWNSFNIWIALIIIGAILQAISLVLSTPFPNLQ
ncbi:MAG: hypothetical protein ACT4ON_14320 [Bacteroidota bacterium]